MRIPTATLLSTIALALMAPGPQANAADRSKERAVQEVRHPEDLFVVDCLLPSRVRNLGRNMKFASPRQVILTTAHDCGLRGGQYTLDPSKNDFALQAWLAQAEGGDAEAANNVGEIYEQGVRGRPDLAQAAVWYRKAADSGSRRAQRNLAHCYETGRGVERDAVQAIVWARKAAGLAGEADLNLEKEVAALRSEVAKLTGELQQAKGELARNEAELSAARSALASAEGELAAAERELASARTAAVTPAKPSAPAPPRPAAPKSEIAVAETAVVTRKAVVESSREKVATLEAAQDRYRRLASELESSAAAAKELAARGPDALIAKRAPAIEFLRPDVLATRGPAVVPVPAGAREVEIVGRVSAELGLAEFTAAGRHQEVADDGIFRLRLTVDPGKPIPFVAVDRAARRTEAELVFGTPAAAAAAGSTTVQAAAPSAAGRRFHALVVAGASYRSLAPLSTAIADGEELANMLRSRYGFDVTWLPDATFLGAMQRLTELAARLGPEDDLLVYFAGHGRIDAAGRGYWLPVDASPDDPSTWIPNVALAKIFSTMRAGRVLVVADSCYAGALGGSAPEASNRSGAGAKAGPRVRSVLSSGGLAPVLDEGAGTHSIFARALLTVLSLAHEPISADRLFQAVSARVAYRSAELGATQRPEYAPIGFAGHEGGDFVFQPVI